MQHGHLVTDLNSTGSEHLLDYLQAQGKADVELDNADHLGREAVASLERGARLFSYRLVRGILTTYR